MINNETLDLIRKSKIDYIQKYVNEIDPKSLKEAGLERGKLFETLKSYYDRAEEQKRF